MFRNDEDSQCNLLQNQFRNFIQHVLDKTWAADLYLHIQTRAEGESLYIRYRSDANVLSYLKNDPSYEFIGEVILKINIV
jgi:hypothetical protein